MSALSHSLVRQMDAGQLDLMQTMDAAFPTIDPGIQPFGSRVLVQIRTPQSKTRGGLFIADETRETEKWNQQVAKLIAIGPVAFKDRKTMQPWPEGEWAKAGVFVRVPKFGGDRWEVEYRPEPGQPAESALFVLFNDLDLLGLVTTDPRTVKAFI